MKYSVMTKSIYELLVRETKVRYDLLGHLEFIRYTSILCCPTYA